MAFNLQKYQYRTSKLKLGIKLIILSGVITVVLVSAVIILNIKAIGNLFTNEKNVIKNVSELWNAGQYEDVIVESQKKLDKNPLDAEALVYFGFAQFHRAFYDPWKIK